MSKELDYINERIERLEFHIAHPNEYNITPTIKVKINDGAVYKEEVATLKRIKQRLESIDNANPSEALKCLERINKEYLTIESEDFDNCFNTIKQALLKAQEQEKVLEIMFDKTVSIFQLRCCKNVDEYNDLKFNDFEKLTQEEFDLLKRWQNE